MTWVLNSHNLVVAQAEQHVYVKDKVLLNLLIRQHMAWVDPGWRLEMWDGYRSCETPTRFAEWEIILHYNSFYYLSFHHHHAAFT